jgi:hypothetical protein
MLVLLTAGMPLNAAELAPLSSRELHERCLEFAESPDSAGGQVCSAYLRAFVEGSQLVTIEPVTVAGESFTQRAFRTRMGAPARALAPRYCLDSSLTMNAFVIQLLVQAERATPSDATDASTLVYATLGRYHRCA